VSAPRHADAGAAVEVFPDQRSLFAVPPDVAYFNTASLSPQLHSVREAGEAALRSRGEPWTITSRDWFDDVERLRCLAGALFGADPEGVALVPATSYGFAIAARNLPLRPGSRILVLADEYPSGIYTWRRQAQRTGSSVLTVRRQAGGSWTEAVLAELDERVGLVSVPNVHWTDGAPVDLAAISDRVRDVGAHLVIDASQSLGALPLDVEHVRPDFVIAVGYKWLLGPFGLGYLYAADEHRGGEPLEENWILRAGSEDFAALVDYRDEYQPGARRFDVGQRTNFELTPMAIAALEQLLAWSTSRIRATLAATTEAISTQLSALGFDIAPEPQRAPHLLGVVLPPTMRAGLVPYLERANCFVALRGPSMRIAPHMHTTPADIDRLIDSLRAATRELA
jgi:selenocysteine lyase/cysteine desulfurase